MGWAVLGLLIAIAITGGMFVVPLYAFLTTTVEKSQTARTVAANNIVNSGFMVFGSVGIFGMQQDPRSRRGRMHPGGGGTRLASAWCANRLYKAEDAPPCPTCCPEPARPSPSGDEGEEADEEGREAQCEELDVAVVPQLAADCATARRTWRRNGWRRGA